MKRLLLGLLIVLSLLILAGFLLVCFSQYLPLPEKLSKTVETLRLVFDREEAKLKAWEKIMDRYHAAINKGDISLCQDKEFPQDTKCFCQAIIAKDVNYCNQLKNIKDVTGARHLQCVEDVVETMPSEKIDKQVCFGLQSYNDNHYYYQCRAKFGKDITECEAILTSNPDFKDKRGDYEVFLGECFLEAIDSIGDTNLCYRLKELEDQYGFSSFYSSTCFEKYGIKKPEPIN